MTEFMLELQLLEQVSLRVDYIVPEDRQAKRIFFWNKREI